MRNKKKGFSSCVVLMVGIAYMSASYSADPLSNAAPPQQGGNSAQQALEQLRMLQQRMTPASGEKVQSKSPSPQQNNNVAANVPAPAAGDDTQLLSTTDKSIST